MKLTQRQSLFEQYKMKSEEELKAIIADDGYEDIAKDVAREILNSDRTEYHKGQEEIKQAEQRYEQINQEKKSAQQVNPLYDDIHQIANDVRFIKNVIIAGVVISVALTIISIIINSAA